MKEFGTLKCKDCKFKNTITVSNGWSKTRCQKEPHKDFYQIEKDGSCEFSFINLINTKMATKGECIYPEWDGTLGYGAHHFDKKGNCVICGEIKEKTELNIIECMDCGYVCKEKDLENRTGKHSKDEIVCCPKCESKDLKYY